MKDYGSNIIIISEAGFLFCEKKNMSFLARVC